MQALWLIGSVLVCRLLRALISLIYKRFPIFWLNYVVKQLITCRYKLEGQQGANAPVGAMALVPAGAYIIFAWGTPGPLWQRLSLSKNEAREGTGRPGWPACAADPAGSDRGACGGPTQQLGILFPRKGHFHSSFQWFS